MCSSLVPQVTLEWCSSTSFSCTAQTLENSTSSSGIVMCQFLKYKNCEFKILALNQFHEWKCKSPGLGIYPLLNRKKKGVAPQERLRELKEHFLLQKIEKEIPGQLTKVLIVQGDSQEIGENVTLPPFRSIVFPLHEISKATINKYRF